MPQIPIAPIVGISFMDKVLHFRDQLAVAICDAVGVPMPCPPQPKETDEMICVPVVDLDEFHQGLKMLASEAPEVIQDIVAFLRRKGATPETGRRVVDYLLVIADCPAGDANHLIALRFRNTQERVAASAALYSQPVVLDGH